MLYVLSKVLTARLELNFAASVILRGGDIAATHKILEISLEYDAILVKSFATILGELYAATTLIPCIKATSMHH